MESRTGSLLVYAQENLDLDGQPDGGAQGMDDPPELIRNVPEEIVFCTSRLSHSGHCTVAVSSDEILSSSNCFAHFLQTYS